MTNFTPGNELCINGKWFFDVTEAKDDSLTVRVKYKESPTRHFYLYKEVKLPTELITILETNDNVMNCSVDLNKLKTLWGSLVDRLVKESNPYKMKVFEDASANAGNTGGMGSVSQPGLSGSPGIPGSAGSGDVAGGRPTKYYMNGSEKNDKDQSSIKKAMMDLLGMSEELNVVDDTDNDYKKQVYQFMEWPWTVDAEIDIAKEANNWRAEFLNASPVRVKEYFKQLSALNAGIIKSRCSETFQNQIAALSA